MAVSLPSLRRGRGPRGGRPARRMTLDYSQDLRIFPSWWAKAGLVLLLVLYLFVPTEVLPFIAVGDPGLRTLALVGIFAIGAIGLNLLTGFTGQVSLGHAFFIGVGAYTAGYLGVERGWPLPVYLVAAALIGFGLGAIIGPFALRLRGHYLVIVTLGLLFLGQHVFNNWDSVTGGNRGRSGLRAAPQAIGPLDFTGLELFGTQHSAGRSQFWLVWALVALAALLAKNLVRSRMGRAMQAVRDRDLSAEVIGVDLARTKVGAFAWSSAYAAVAGVLWGIWAGRAAPDDFGLFKSIEYIAVVIIGGIGLIFGPILGAVFVVGGQELIRANSGSALFEPVLNWFTIGELNAILFGLFIILFLMFEPRGLAALWIRVKLWFLTWPFSY